MRALLPAAVALLAGISCGPPAEPSLDELLRSGYRELALGNPAAAYSRGETGATRARAEGSLALERAFVVLRAEALVDQGRLADAVALVDELLDAGSAPDRLVARARMTRGRAQCLAGTRPSDPGTREADLEAAERLAEQHGSTALAAEVARHRGTCALMAGDYPQAEQRYRQSLVLSRRALDMGLEAKALGSLGLLKVRVRRYDEATDWLEKTLDLATRLHAELDVVRTLTNLGWCRYTLGDYEVALDLLSRAEALTRASGYEGRRVLVLQNLGNVHYQLRDLDAAASRYREALELSKTLADRRLTAELLGNLAIVALERGRYDAAEAFVDEVPATGATADDPGSALYPRLTQGQIWQGRGDAARAEAAYESVLRSPHADPELRWETLAAMARLRAQQGRAREAERTFHRAFDVMDQIRSELGRPDNRISFFSSLRRFHDDYVAFLVGAGRIGEALEAADRSRARLLRESLGSGAEAAAGLVHFQRVARAEGAVVLFYWTAPERSLLWRVTGTGVALHELPGEAEIRRRVDDHQARVQRGRDLLAERPAASEWLYSRLVAPAGLSGTEGARVIVVPDGPLYRLDFDTLVVPSPAPHYWIEDVTLAVAPSLALLAAERPASRPPRRALIIGDPAPASAEFPRLPYAGREIEAVAGLFAPAERTVLSGEAARPSGYRAADPGEYSFIHLAAHAKANPQVPLDSAVILSPEAETYKLYAREIVSVPIRADLVTLSACRSAGSRAFAGEGLVGLAWAFLSAGAGSVVAGLWNVEDASTAQIMGSLYLGLSEGQAPAEALRAAKLRMMRSGTAYRKPYYWAPFVVYTRRAPGSDTRPGPERPSSPRR